MSSSFAYAQVQGNLGKDPESRVTPSGTKIVTFSLAVEQGYGDSKSTGWYTIKAFGKGAEFSEKHLKKGSNVRLSGDLQIDSWDDRQTGQKRTATVILTHKVDFGESRGESKSSAPTRQAAAPPTRQQAAPPPRAAVAEADPFGDDDIPF
jgi:single-strand DNA-binding protein